MAKVELHLGKVPEGVDERVKMVADVYRRLTGKEPTSEGLADARARLEGAAATATTGGAGETAPDSREAEVRIDDSNYTETHGRKPSGTGAWAFSTVDPNQADHLNHVIWVRGSFDEAVQKAVRIAAKRGIDKLWVCG